METDNLDRSLLESRFERLISKSKNYINTRNEVELESLRNDLIHLKLKVETEIDKSRKKDKSEQCRRPQAHAIHYPEVYLCGTSDGESEIEKTDMYRFRHETDA